MCFQAEKDNSYVIGGYKMRVLVQYQGRLKSSYMIYTKHHSDGVIGKQYMYLLKTYSCENVYKERVTSFQIYQQKTKLSL